MPDNQNSYFRLVKQFFIDVGDVIIFSGKVLRQMITPPFEPQQLYTQAYLIGNKSLSLIAITGFIMGLVLTMQSGPVMEDFGAKAMIPGMISISLVREIGPVITGLLCAGKISSGIAAELGAMKVTEQIDAMEVSGTKPLSYVVASRILAATIMVPVLVFFADAFGLFGSYVAINFKDNVSFSLFFNRAMSTLVFADIFSATIKSVFFGFFVGLIGSYKGYQVRYGTEEVGKAANSAVVVASLTIFIIDLLATQVVEVFVGY